MSRSRMMAAFGSPNTYFFVTNAKEHENNTMEGMNLKKGDRAAMDRGYFNASEFHRT